MDKREKKSKSKGRSNKRFPPDASCLKLLATVRLEDDDKRHHGSKKAKAQAECEGELEAHARCTDCGGCSDNLASEGPSAGLCGKNEVGDDLAVQRMFWGEECWAETSGACRFFIALEPRVLRVSQSGRWQIVRSLP